MAQQSIVDVSKLRRSRTVRTQPKGRAGGRAGASRGAGAARRRAAAARPADRVPAPDPGSPRPLSRRAHRRARAGDAARDDRGLRGRDVLPPLRRRRRKARRRRRRSPCASARRCRARWPAPTRCAPPLAKACGRGRARHRRALHRPLRARAGGGRRPQSGRPRDGRSDRRGRGGGTASSPRFRRYIDLRGLSDARRLSTCSRRASQADATSRP